MTLGSGNSLLRSLYTQVPRGAPVDSKALQALGVSSALAWHYVKEDWLTRLGRGLFMFPNDQLDRDACLLFLSKKIPGLHVGGKSALAWRGIRHNLPVREQVTLWGDISTSLPDWFTSRFQARYTTRKLFRKKVAGFGVQPLPESPKGPLVSVPERALLEMLSEVGVRVGLEEGRNLMEGMRFVRPEVLQEFLKNCLVRKVVRLCVQWAEELNLEWAVVARQATKRRYGRSRWTARYKDGTTLILEA